MSEILDNFTDTALFNFVEHGTFPCITHVCWTCYQHIFVAQGITGLSCVFVDLFDCEFCIGANISNYEDTAELALPDNSVVDYYVANDQDLQAHIINDFVILYDDFGNISD